MQRRSFLASLLASPLLAGSGEAEAGTSRRITDPTGRSVLLPARIERIGCLTGASYEKAFLVGAGNKVVVRAATNPPWMEQTNPAVRQISVLLDSHQPNIEELLRLKPDLLFSWDDQALTHKLEENGLTVICPQPRRNRLSSTQAFIDLFKSEVSLYGQALGAEAGRRSEAWSALFDRISGLVRQRTAGLHSSQRPATYYLRGPSALTTHGAEENISWLGEMAGADMVVRRAVTQSISNVSMEQMLVWNPEVIFVGRQYSPDLVLRDPRWSSIRAVRNGRVHAIPDGVFFWDSSSEGALLLLYLAKTLHPERFSDIDLVHEVRAYYQNFYRYPLSPAEAAQMLRGLNPKGQRFNPRGN